MQIFDDSFVSAPSSHDDVHATTLSPPDPASTMSRAVLRPVLQLRPPAAAAAWHRQSPAAAAATLMRPRVTARGFNSTPPIVETAATGAATASSPDPPPRAPQSPPVSVPATAPEVVRSLLPLLAAQPAHFVTVHIHGKPYLVTAGDRVKLPFRLQGVQPGDGLRINRASVLG